MKGLNLLIGFSVWYCVVNNLFPVTVILAFLTRNRYQSYTHTFSILNQHGNLFIPTRIKPETSNKPKGGLINLYNKYIYSFMCINLYLHIINICIILLGSVKIYIDTNFLKIKK